ncbi:MAG: hypothetical protein IJP17_03565 [Clostridia bacterium]|nr:hypothetical protein [Clostridia bacterium]
MENNKSYVKRFAIMMSLIVIIVIVFEVVLMRIQLVDGEQYADQAKQYTATSLNITAARGEIVDRYGRAIAENRMGYNILFNRAEMPSEDEEENNIIWHLTSILSEAGEPWIDNCPIEISASGHAEFVEGESSEKLISNMKSTLNLQSYATAQNCLDTMNELYKVGNLSSDVARTIMGVRLNMEQMDFSSANPYTFAEDVSLETIQKVMENAELLDGVEVSVVPIREYADGTIAPHLIGITGPIYKEEYEELKKQGYKITATIGKFGIEKTCEEYLKGTDGVKKVQRNEEGEIVYEQVTKEAKPGNTVVLTIDSELQRIGQKSLGNTIEAIAAQGKASGIPQNGEDANAGSLVVINVHTFEVLAAVTYPSYSLDEYSSNYDGLLKQDGGPLFNRCLNGTYAPGSTFKPAVALAGLQEGVIKKYTELVCTGKYTIEGSDLTLKCEHVDGSINVTSAIAKSCNSFFYEVGERLGITKMNDYCKQLGFGVATGIGMGESVGILAGREERERQELGWYHADTLTAAIGQNDNKFTPMQMAVYTATIANGGTRYEARIIKAVKSYDMSETVVQDTSESPVVYNELNVEKTLVNVVKEGMRQVTEEGTASATFENYPMSVGGKTGTANTRKDATANAIFLAFAPFDEPEIAVVIIGEKCGYGSGMAPIARDLFDYYFYSDQTDGYHVPTEGGLVR